MTSLQSYTSDPLENIDDKSSVQSPPQRVNALSSKISSLLSASYADSEIRDVLRTLDEKQIKNGPEIRRNVRLDLQKEVIERNGEIVKDFGHVAEVGLPVCVPVYRN